MQFGKTVSTALFISLLAIGNPAHAVGWEYGQRIGISSNYESNPLLTNDDLDAFDNDADNDERDPEDTFRFLAFYELELEGREGNKSFTIEPRISRDYYPDRDKSELESTDYDVPATIAITLPTSRWNLGFGAKRQNILSSEAINETGGNNRFRADDTVFNYNVSPSVSWTPTQKDSVFISGNWRKQDYDLDYTGRSDFEGYNGAFAYSRLFTQRQTIGFTAGISSSESDGINCRIDLVAPFDPQPTRGEATPPCEGFNQPTDLFLTVNAQNKNSSDRTSLTLDYTFSWSETLEFRASAGRENTETEQEIFDFAGNTLLFEQFTTGGGGVPVPTNKIKSDSDGETYSFVVTKQTERGDVRFSAGRGTVLQSSTGTPQDRDSYDIDISTRLTQKLRSIVRLGYSKQQSVFAENADSNSLVGRADRDREFYTAEAVLRYQLSRNLNVFTSYRYRQRDEDGLRTGEINGIDVPRVVELTANSNQVRFGMVYNFKRLAR